MGVISPILVAGYGDSKPNTGGWVWGSNPNTGSWIWSSNPNTGSWIWGSNPNSLLKLVVDAFLSAKEILAYVVCWNVITGCSSWICSH